MGTLMDAWYVPGMAWSEPAAQAGPRPQQAAGRRLSRPAAPTPGLHTGAHARSPAIRHQSSSGRVCPSSMLHAQQRQRAGPAHASGHRRGHPAGQPAWRAPTPPDLPQLKRPGAQPGGRTARTDSAAARDVEARLRQVAHARVKRVGRPQRQRAVGRGQRRLQLAAPALQVLREDQGYNNPMLTKLVRSALPSARPRATAGSGAAAPARRGRACAGPGRRSRQGYQCMSTGKAAPGCGGACRRRRCPGTPSRPGTRTCRGCAPAWPAPYAGVRVGDCTGRLREQDMLNGQGSRMVVKDSLHSAASVPVSSILPDALTSGDTDGVWDVMPQQLGLVGPDKAGAQLGNSSRCALASTINLHVLS